MSKHKGPGAVRRLLCALTLHSYVGTSVPHTYQCRYCPDRTAGHP